MNAFQVSVRRFALDFDQLLSKSRRLNSFRPPKNKKAAAPVAMEQAARLRASRGA